MFLISTGQIQCARGHIPLTVDGREHRAQQGLEDGAAEPRLGYGQWKSANTRHRDPLAVQVNDKMIRLINCHSQFHGQGGGTLSSPGRMTP